MILTGHLLWRVGGCKKEVYFYMNIYYIITAHFAERLGGKFLDINCAEILCNLAIIRILRYDIATLVLIMYS